MIRRPPRSTLSSSSAASDVYKRQLSYHNIAYLLQLTRGARAAIQAGTFPEYIRTFMLAYHPDKEYPTWCLSLIHISEPTRLLSISYAVFCLKKKKTKKKKFNNQ
eukprot:TRINITY_DN25393_c0_g1_i2.p1 TRINITY_DN25393_c0_g1~~TRINITY_DN25393_c0_g1_i2.p1  ORF type:complete len:105 (+),score=35.27 TRINITY_DN25393_c0_g1_i2:135-449(+)